MSAIPDETVLQVRSLKKYFPIEKGTLQRVVGHVRAVDDIDFSINKGQTLGLVGESGCGKTTTAWTITRMHTATAGEILFRTGDGEVVDMVTLARKRLKEVRRHMNLIFQDPYGSLNPRKTVLDIVADPLKNHGWDRAKRKERVSDLLQVVGLDPKFMSRYPHAFSGGQRQRIGIARALALSPSLVIADEPVSALDVSVRAQILNLLADLRDELGLTYILVAHDLSVVRHICDRVAVMYVGKIVEEADAADLFAKPRHPYTAGLMAALPEPDPHRRWEPILSGEVAKPSEEITGCVFAHRCPYVRDICRSEQPPLTDGQSGAGGVQRVACHRADELQLEGANG